MKKGSASYLEQEEVCQNVRVGSIKKPPIWTAFNRKIFGFYLTIIFLLTSPSEVFSLAI